MLQARFRCIAGCDVAAKVDDIVYSCPQCGDLMEVQHDVAALQERAPQSWRALFAQRRGEIAFPHSGVWDKREWIAPWVEAEHIVSLGEGYTPLQPLFRFGRELNIDLRVKQCGATPTGSFKDLGMTVLVSTVVQMRAQGKDIKAIACASTGDTSAALASYAAVAEIPSVVLLPRGKISTAQLVQPLASGATVLALDTDFDGCMALVKELADTGRVYLANSMNSLRLEGQKSVVFEIAEQLDWTLPDWIVVPGGNLGNVSALAAGIRLMRELKLVDATTRLCVAQAEKASPLYESYRQGFDTFETVEAQKTAASAIQIGNPVSRDKAIRALRDFDGVVEVATETELSNAAARADLSGCFACPHTGVALAAVEKLTTRGEIKAGQRVVVISTANGLKFAEFKIGYHDEKLSDVTSFARSQKPRHLPATIEAVIGELDRLSTV